MLLHHGWNEVQQKKVSNHCDSKLELCPWDTGSVFTTGGNLSHLSSSLFGDKLVCWHQILYSLWLDGRIPERRIFIPANSTLSSQNWNLFLLNTPFQAFFQAIFYNQQTVVKSQFWIELRNSISSTWLF